MTTILSILILFVFNTDFLSLSFKTRIGKPIINKFAFHIQPIKRDTLQRGTVQPAFGKRGGGKEAYFANGTAPGTYKYQTDY